MLKVFDIFKKAIILTALLAPAVSFAAALELTAIPESVREGDTFAVQARLTNIDKPLNAIEGTIAYDSAAAEFNDSSTGGSIFTLWPESPLYDRGTRSVRFSGGVPNGFSGSEGLVFKLYFTALAPGQASFDPSAQIFLNDGQGTPQDLKVNDLNLNILPKNDAVPVNELQDQNKNDTDPPRPFEITVGRNLGILDGKYFASFYATDDGSGIDHYEIKEGGGQFTRAENPYVLKDQSLKSAIEIKAIDKNGNERVAEFKPSAPAPSASAPPVKLAALAALILVAILIIIVALRHWRKKNRRSKKNVK